MQVFCVFAIAFGTGLFVFGSYLEPRANLLATGAPSLGPLSNDVEFLHYTAAAVCGIGIFFMILGGFGLVLPTVNKIAFPLTSEMSENSLRAIAAMAIWLSVSLILTFGVFRLDWEGGAVSVLLILVTMVSAVATVSMAMVCGWKPWTPTSRKQTNDHPAANDWSNLAELEPVADSVNESDGASPITRIHRSVPFVFRRHSEEAKFQLRLAFSLCINAAWERDSTCR
jgi:hypothetical protein